MTTISSVLHTFFCHSWASVPLLGQLPVDRCQASPLSLPRASLHGHCHPQRAASLHHVSSVPVDSDNFSAWQLTWAYPLSSETVYPVKTQDTDVMSFCVFCHLQVHLPLSTSWLDVTALLHAHPCDHHCDTRPALHSQGRAIMLGVEYGVKEEKKGHQLSIKTCRLMGYSHLLKGHPYSWLWNYLNYIKMFVLMSCIIDVKDCLINQKNVSVQKQGTSHLSFTGSAIHCKYIC